MLTSGQWPKCSPITISCFNSSLQFLTVWPHLNFGFETLDSKTLDSNFGFKTSCAEIVRLLEFEVIPMVFLSLSNSTKPVQLNYRTLRTNFSEQIWRTILKNKFEEHTSKTSRNTSKHLETHRFSLKNVTETLLSLCKLKVLDFLKVVVVLFERPRLQNHGWQRTRSIGYNSLPFCL